MPCIHRSFGSPVLILLPENIPQVHVSRVYQEYTSENGIFHRISRESEHSYFIPCHRKTVANTIKAVLHGNAACTCNTIEYTVAFLYSVGFLWHGKKDNTLACRNLNLEAKTMHSL